MVYNAVANRHNSDLKQMEAWDGVVQQLLNARRQWETVPQIVYLATRAIQNHLLVVQTRFHSLQMQMNDRFAQQQTLLTDVSLRCARFQLNQQQNHSSHYSLHDSSLSSVQSQQRVSLSKTALTEVAIIAAAVVEQKTTHFKQLIQEGLDQGLEQCKHSIEELKQKIQQQEKQDSIVRDNVRTISQNLGALTRHMQQNVLDRHQIEPKLKSILQEYTQIRKNVSTNNVEIKQNRQQFQTLNNRMTRQLSQMLKIQQIQKFFQQKMLQITGNDSHINKQLSLKRIAKQSSKKHSKEQQKAQKTIKNRNILSPTTKCLSPNKHLSAIYNSLSKIQQTLIDKSVVQFSRIEKHLQTMMQNFKETMTREMQKRDKGINQGIERLTGERERHICEVMEEMISNALSMVGEKLKEKDVLINKLLVSARYVHYGAKEARKDSVLVWDCQEKCSQNYELKNNSICVGSPGVYRVEFALFGAAEARGILLINGEEVGQSNSSQGDVRCMGSTFSCIVLLPAKTKVSLRVSQAYYGQAYLCIYKI